MCIGKDVTIHPLSSSDSFATLWDTLSNKPQPEATARFHLIDKVG